jgi:hypothetical protein
MAAGGTKKESRIQIGPLGSCRNWRADLTPPSDGHAVRFANSQPLDPCPPRTCPKIQTRAVRGRDAHAALNDGNVV